MTITLNPNPMWILSRRLLLTFGFIFSLLPGWLSGQTAFNLNINCGGAGFVTSTGETFTADQYFNNGTTFSNTADTVGGTLEDFLYQTERYNANLAYSIPVPQNGFYEVSLHFAEVYFKNQDTNKRVFDMSLEGTLVLDDYDIYASVGGYRADIHTFQVQVLDGVLDLTSTSSVNNAKLCAIQVTYIPPFCADPNWVPTVDTVSSLLCSTDSVYLEGAWQKTAGFYTDTLLNKDACDSVVVTDLQFTVCTFPAFDFGINCGGVAYTDGNGFTYVNDTLFTNGQTFSNFNASIANTNDPFIYQSERYAADLTYEIPVPATGEYLVELHFAEIFNRNFDVNKRVFDITLEDSLVLDEYDIFANVGASTATIKVFRIDVQDTALSLTSTSSINNAKLCAIRVTSAPVDCELGPWSAWSACDVSCGGGMQSRTRQVITPAANGGLPCGPTIEYRTCNNDPCVESGLCPKDTLVWSSATSCGAEVSFALDSSGIKVGGGSASYMNVPQTLNDCPKWASYGYTGLDLTPSGISGTALGTDIDLESVYIQMDHKRVGDLVIDLVSPNGTLVRLIERPGMYGLWGNGGCNKDDIDAYFVAGTGNSAENDCSGNKPVISGTYTAHDGYDLATINDGSDPNGTWTLRVYDLDNKKEPELLGWSLNFRSYMGSIIQIAGLPSGSEFPVGTTTNTMVFTDSTGASDTCSFDVTVEDHTAPVFDQCPQDVYACGDPVSWTPPTATDNCGSVNVVQISGPAMGSSLADGTYPVTYHAVDQYGNESMCSFNLIKAPLTVDAGADQVIYTGGGSNWAWLWGSVQNGQWPYTFSWSDGSNGPLNIVSPGSTTDYILTVTDANGCTGTDTVTVEVVDISCGYNKVMICYNDVTYCVNSFLAWYYTTFAGASYGSCNTNMNKRMGDPAQLDQLIANGQEAGDDFLTAFPNPFNQSTTVEYAFMEGENLEIGLYDITGKLIYQLYQGENNPGMKGQIEIDASELPEGIYLVIARTEYASQSLRIHMQK